MSDFNTIFEPLALALALASPGPRRIQAIFRIGKTSRGSSIWLVLLIALWSAGWALNCRKEFSAEGR